MKHFNAQTGGRYTYTDDIENLQALALAINSIFDGCDNFIISGCEVNGSSISEGYVYINGEIRRFGGATNQNWPSYIYEKNSQESVAYVSGSSKVGRTIYGADISRSVPSTVDTITNAVPQYIAITANGGKRMKDAFFGKYAMILSPATGSQVINGQVDFNGITRVLSDFYALSHLNVTRGSNNFRFFWEDNSFIAEANGVDTPYRFTVHPTRGVIFKIGDTETAVISSSAIKAIAVEAQSGTLGSIKIIGNSIYNNSDVDNGVIAINMVGHDGSINQFRNTIIGDGKGVALLSLNGSKKTATFDATIQANKTIILNDPLHSSTDQAYVSSITWTGNDDKNLGSFGFTSSTSKDINLINIVGAIKVVGNGYVDLGPEIRENGTSLTNKYLTQLSFNDTIKNYILSKDVYSKTDADGKFSTKSGGLSQFISSTNTKEVLRKQIEAVSEADVKKFAPQLNKYLSDMATDETAKQTIRNNIGASAADDCQPKLKNTGWIRCSGQASLYARQFGSIVCIQGKVVMKHNQLLFSLPTDIDGPGHDVVCHVDKYKFGAYILGGQRFCTSSCDDSNNHDKTTSFSMTYMI